MGGGRGEGEGVENEWVDAYCAHVCMCMCVCVCVCVCVCKGRLCETNICVKSLTRLL